MAITYRTAGAWGAGQGYNLDAAQIDANFYFLDQRVQDLIDNPPQAVGISNITVVGTQMTIYLADATVLGPYTLPQAAFRPSTVAEIDGDTSGIFEPTLGNRNAYLRYLGSASLTVMLPGDDEVAFAVDDEITFRQVGDGVISFDAVTGVVIDGMAGFLNQTAGKGSTITAKKVAANEWELIGRLAEDVTS
ncbi:hypothetical protein [Mesorhizobium sp. M2A.F.Ca.ET.067.02.1.1]|uniref:hypothetical protein n=1 Tax=Mesorhizobium sp. M2A.F.Ca.ET.067.02.1.1 TaxID=2496749 RepID=UPI000FD284EE|nr:hypothetical protein [Mesorhizobium sp. M2A.F.Ca.ET.067.02.1.1]RUW79623.1 hypothetical protein EOA28_07450 [Mesorhizobium sp. M2A.F.Ca.ET.067.02.1.1]